MRLTRKAGHEVLYPFGDGFRAPVVDKRPAEIGVAPEDEGKIAAQEDAKRVANDVFPHFP